MSGKIHKILNRHIRQGWVVKLVTGTALSWLQEEKFLNSRPCVGHFRRQGPSPIGRYTKEGESFKLGEWEKLFYDIWLQMAV